MCHPEFFLFSKASPGSKKWRKTSEQKRNRQTTHLFPKGSDRINISVIQPWWILQTLALCLYMILLFSPYLHFSFQCSFLCPQSQLHIHSSGVSVAWRPVSGMAKHECAQGILTHLMTSSYSSGLLRSVWICLCSGCSWGLSSYLILSSFPLVV